MKLALYLPNFRDQVTVKELEDLTALAEELDFDSVWTLDRIVVPEASDRGELQYPFGMMEQFPTAMPVSARGKWFQGWPLIPWLAAKTSKVPDRHEHHRHAVPRARACSPPRSPPSTSCRTAGSTSASASGWMPEEFAAASASHIFPKRHKHVRETIEIMQGIWTNDAVRVPRRVRRLRPLRVRRQAGAEAAPADLLQRLKDPKRSANRIAKYGLSGWIGIQDTPEEITRWRTEIQRELDEARQRPVARRRLRHVQHDLVRHHRRADRPDAATAS